LAIGKRPGRGPPLEARRTIAACDAKSSGDDDPDPIQPSPIRAARRSAGSRPAPSQIGTPGRWTGLGSTRARENA
jgi:hypothetical protein